MSKRIIIYDDDKDILTVTSVILQMKGYEVMCREDCLSLEGDLNSFKPEVILMDNRLPGMGGVKAVQYIKKHDHFKHIPVILFSANSNVEDIAREAGADRVLRKPFEILELQQMIANTLQ